MSIMFWVHKIKKTNKKKKLLHRRHEIQGQVSPPVYTIMIIKRERNFTKADFLCVCIEKMDLETCHGFLSDSRTV